MGHRLISSFPAPLRLIPLAVRPFCGDKLIFTRDKSLESSKSGEGGQSEYAAEEMSECWQNWERPAAKPGDYTHRKVQFGSLHESGWSARVEAA